MSQRATVWYGSLLETLKTMNVRSFHYRKNCKIPFTRTYLALIDKAPVNCLQLRQQMTPGGFTRSGLILFFYKCHSSSLCHLFCIVTAASSQHFTVIETGKLMWWPIPCRIGRYVEIASSSGVHVLVRNRRDPMHAIVSERLVLCRVFYSCRTPPSYMGEKSAECKID